MDNDPGPLLTKTAKFKMTDFIADPKKTKLVLP